MILIVTLFWLAVVCSCQNSRQFSCMKTTHYFFTNSHEPWFRGMTAHWGWCIGILVSQIGQLLVWFQHRLSWFSLLLLVVTLCRLHCFCHTHSEASSVLWIGNLFPQSYKYRSYSIILVSICSHIVRKNNPSLIPILNLLIQIKEFMWNGLWSWNLCMPYDYNKTLGVSHNHLCRPICFKHS